MRLKLNAITLIITVLVFLAIQYFYSNIVIAKPEVITNEKIYSEPVKVQEQNILAEQITLEEKPKAEIIEEQSVWQIEIPTINLKAEIEEGTTNEIMNQYVGHFENTEIWNRKCWASST